MKKKDIYTYKLHHNLYINLTNRCSNRCDFCVRNHHDGVGGYYLWLSKEPTAQQVIDEIGDPRRFKEIVFCGFGEPMCRLDALLEIARHVKESGGKTRINTNGQANLIHGRDITPSLKDKIDVVSISLNAANAAEYQMLCHSEFGEQAYQAIIDFATRCAKHVPRVILSAVDVLSCEEIEQCKLIAKGAGVEFRLRHYIDD